MTSYKEYNAMKTVKIAAVAVATSLMASAASAATLGLIGGGYQNQVIANYDLMPDLDGATVQYLTGDVKNDTNGLAATGPGTVTFTYLGSEAGNTNYSARVANGTMFTEASTVGSMASYTVAAGTNLLDFFFGTLAPLGAIGQIYNDGAAVPNSNDFAIGYYQSSGSWYALFDDIQASDRDFDDFALRIDIAPVPLPAAGFLLLAGLGAMGAVARRRKA
jgi:hypothetical protein